MNTNNFSKLCSYIFIRKDDLNLLSFVNYDFGKLEIKTTAFPSPKVGPMSRSMPYSKSPTWVLSRSSFLWIPTEEIRTTTTEFPSWRCNAASLLAAEWQSASAYRTGSPTEPLSLLSSPRGPGLPPTATEAPLHRRVSTRPRCSLRGRSTFRARGI